MYINMLYGLYSDAQILSNRDDIGIISHKVLNLVKCDLFDTLFFSMLLLVKLSSQKLDKT